MNLHLDPDQLLQGIQKEEGKSSRGKLKIFFGMCPGVGKTFAMLRAAQEKKKEGISVLVGLVETHGRADTEKNLEGLELLPRKTIDHRGTTFTEFDLDRALALKPTLILVDELAHTNAPGSRHPKRYQDVKDLLFAGIDVYTTVNVQHIESRSDLVYQISGVPVRETVPDAFMELADQIELIDLAPVDLLRRLQDGKVYLAEGAQRAADHFFKEEKLMALRELALRFTAEMVDDQLRDQMQAKRIAGPWNTNERLMVAISQSPSSARLIRTTRRMAYNLEAPWVALYVNTGGELLPEDLEILHKNLNLARELGAEVVTTAEHSVAHALQRIAAERNVTQIVMGRPDRRFIRDALTRGTILDQLVNETSEVDIHVIRQKRKPIYRGFHFRLPSLHAKGGTYLRTLLYILGLCALSYLFREPFGYRALGFVLLLGILPISTFASLGPTLFGAGLSALAWNFLFIPPQFTFAIKEPEDVMMMLTFFGVASMAGFLAGRIKRQERDLLRRERRSNTLYRFSKNLAEAKNDSELVRETAESIRAIFNADVVFLKKGPSGILLTDAAGDRSELTEKDRAVATWAFENHEKAGWRTNTLSSSLCLCIPLRGRTDVIGVLLLFPKTSLPLSIDQENLIDTISTHFATALEREHLESVSRKNEIYEKSEKLHQALLNTVSHELRTPLTSIIGGATALGDPKMSAQPEIREKLALDVIESAERLNQTIENLMDMSRISSGVLKLTDQLFELGDFVRSVVERSARFTPAHSISLNISDENLFVRGDERILEHVLQNLLSNAARYSAQGTTIEIETLRHGNFAALLIRDEGPGIPAVELAKIFHRFYRVPGSPPGGVGLGLSIANSIVDAHGGKIHAENRSDRSGAVFTIELPMHSVPKEKLE